MKNLICNAYAYIEFGGDFAKYCNDLFNINDNQSDEQLQKYWNLIIADYKTASEFMSDESIKQAQQLVMANY